MPLLAATLLCTTASAPAALADQLVVRTRAGLHPQVRSRTFAEHRVQEIRSIEALGASIVRVPRGTSSMVARALRRSGYFKSIEPDYRASAAQVPNDPDYPSQWGIPQIGGPAAWNVTLGDGVIVAVVDSGIDSMHPDLQGQLTSGYDFINDDADPSDDNGHGTRMAGVIAAAAFDGIGVAGVAPHSKLLPVKVLGSDGSGPYSSIAAGITYAADHGARVINLSLAGTAPSDLLQSAVDYAVARGAVVVAAAGNYGTGAATYPAACTNAVAVSATDVQDTVASFSTYGSWLGLAAPGVNILTTNWNASGSPSYVASTGTSPAAAFVSGAFALLLANHPEYSNAQAVSVMTGAAHDIETVGWDASSGWGRVDIAAALALPSTTTPEPTPLPTPSAKPHAPKVSIGAPANYSLVYGNVAIDVAAQDDVGVTAVDLLVDNVVVATDSAAPFGFVWDTSSSASGPHLLAARAHNAVGLSARSRRLSVQVTPGVGLLIKHARLAAAPQGATLSLTAVFTLPDEVTLDAPNVLSATLSSTKGTVFSTQANNVVANSRGGLRFTAPTADGAGLLTVRISRLKRRPNYQLVISGRGVQLANVDAVMSLAVSINAATLSQSTSFRSTRTGLRTP